MRRDPAIRIRLPFKEKDERFVIHRKKKADSAEDPEEGLDLLDDHSDDFM